MATNLTAATPYATSAQAKKFVDWRSLADLCSRSSTAARLTEAQFDADETWLAARLGASGLIEQACLAGGRYTPAALAALEGAAAGNLQMLVAWLAQGVLVLGRPNKDTTPPVTFTMAERQLELLRSGERIFGTQEGADAGRLSHSLMTPAEVASRNDRVNQARGYFGKRSTMQ